MRCLTIWMILVLLSGLGVCEGGPHWYGPRGPMAKETFEILRAAVKEPSKVASWVHNLRTLERLARTPWPRLTGLPYLHVRIAWSKGETTVCAWLLHEDADSVILLDVSLQEKRLSQAECKLREPADFAADVRDFIKAQQARDPVAKRPWDFTHIEDLSGNGGFPFRGGVYPLQLAYAAAEMTLPEEAQELVMEALSTSDKALDRFYNEQVWTIFRPAMLAFQDGAPRAEFLATCKWLLANYPGSDYEQELTTLIAPMEREAAAPPPAYLTKPAARRTPEETAQYWVYQLREEGARQFSNPGYPALFSFSGMDATAADQLVHLGPVAIPYLVKALEDNTPTRTIAWQRSFYPVYFVLRRQDIAMKCLECIAGCRFYNERASYIHLYMDKPERRQSAINNVKEWWKQSRDATQAQMVRNQLKLSAMNEALNVYDRLFDLQVLAALEGPEAIIAEARAMLRDDHSDLNSSVVELMNDIDPQAPLRAAFARFKANASRGGDYTLLYRYGDRAIFQEITRRFTEAHHLNLDSWGMGDQFRAAARYGQNWAIPMLAEGLTFTKMTGARWTGHNSQSCSDADVAIEELQKLTGKDFGYKAEMEEQARLAIIATARAWWEKEGKQQFADTIAKNHPPVEPVADLFLTDEEIAARVKAISNQDAVARWQTITSAAGTQSFQIQRALLNRLPIEPVAAIRLQILQALQSTPKDWFLSALTTAMSKDVDAEVRTQAALLITKIMRNKQTNIWQVRLETREAALAAARRLVRDPKTSPALHDAASAILKNWGSFVDAPPPSVDQVPYQ